MVRFSLATIALVATTVMAAPVDEATHSHAKREDFEMMLELTVPPGSDNNNVNNAVYTPVYIPTQLVEDLASEQGAEKSVARSLYKPSSKPIKSGSGQAKYILKTANGWRKAVGFPLLEWDDQLAEQAKLSAKTSCFTNDVAISPDASWMAWVGQNKEAEQDWLATIRGIFNSHVQYYGSRLEPENVNSDNHSFYKSSVLIKVIWKSFTKIGCGYDYCDESKPNHPRETKIFCLWDGRLPEVGDVTYSGFLNGSPESGEVSDYVENLPNKTVIESVDWSKVY